MDPFIGADMWNVECIRNYGKMWRIGEGFMADSCRLQETVTEPRPGAIIRKAKYVGKDIDGKTFSLPAKSFKVTKA